MRSSVLVAMILDNAVDLYMTLAYVSRIAKTNGIDC